MRENDLKSVPVVNTHQRPHEWTKPPRRIELIECIGCDSCMRACPPQFNAVYNYGLDVVIVPEMCNVRKEPRASHHRF